MVIGGTNEEICFSGANIDEEHPGTFGRVQNCRLDIEGTLWEVGIHDAVKNRALTSVRVSGLHRAGVRLKPKVFFFHDFIRNLAKIEGTAGGLQCWLLLLRKFGTVQDGGLYFLALEKAEGAVSNWVDVYRRIGLILLSWDDGEVGERCILPGKRTALSLV